MDKKEPKTDFSDTRETIQRASEASGAKQMLDELAKKMRGAGSISRYDYPKVSICDELIAIVNEPYKGQQRIPNISKRKTEDIVGGYILRITLPKKDSIYHHGSEYSIECTAPYRIQGTMTTALIDTNVVEKLKGLHCIILDIHNHDMLSIKSSHIHFRCENRSAEQIKDITRFLRNY